MSEFQFVCPFCEVLLDCPEKLNGVETECPVCKKQIIPTKTHAAPKNKSSYECYSKDSIKDIINKKYKPPKKKNSQFSFDEWSKEHPTMFSVMLIIIMLLAAAGVIVPCGMMSWENGKKSAYP